MTITTWPICPISRVLFDIFKYEYTRKTSDIGLFITDVVDYYFSKLCIPYYIPCDQGDFCSEKTLAASLALYPHSPKIIIIINNQWLNTMMIMCKLRIDIFSKAPAAKLFFKKICLSNCRC
jgi:hypothetical protein